MFWCGYFLVKLKQRGWRKKGRRRIKKEEEEGEEGDERRRMGEGERSRGKWRELLSPITMILRKE